MSSDAQTTGQPESPQRRSTRAPASRASVAVCGRWQDNIIQNEIPEGASVLDLGCGSGELLARLIREKGALGQGFEVDAEQVMRCIERGVPVFQGDLNTDLRGLREQSYDYVVLEETLQTLMRPVDVLNQMLRVGRRGIVSFPNFGHWRVRTDLANRGRMPVTEWLPHRWYDSPNIHLFTLHDFQDWAQMNNVRVREGYAVAGSRVRKLHSNDNTRAEQVLLIVERSADESTAPDAGL